MKTLLKLPCAEHGLVGHSQGCPACLRLSTPEKVDPWIRTLLDRALALEGMRATVTTITVSSGGGPRQWVSFTGDADGQALGPFDGAGGWQISFFEPDEVHITVGLVTKGNPRELLTRSAVICDVAASLAPHLFETRLGLHSFGEEPVR